MLSSETTIRIFCFFIAVGFAVGSSSPEEEGQLLHVKRETWLNPGFDSMLHRRESQELLNRPRPGRRELFDLMNQDSILKKRALLHRPRPGRRELFRNQGLDSMLHKRAMLNRPRPGRRELFRNPGLDSMLHKRGQEFLSGPRPGREIRPRPGRRERHPDSMLHRRSSDTDLDYQHLLRNPRPGRRELFRPRPGHRELQHLDSLLHRRSEEMWGRPRPGKREVYYEDDGRSEDEKLLRVLDELKRDIIDELWDRFQN
uniref:Pp8 n=1 Tax=Clytia hemisphaerica TaxID=252671 RepID=A0A1W6LRZ2_9CNID|nr:pp8 precursor [Clytia hemisphaerica]